MKSSSFATSLRLLGAFLFFHLTIVQGGFQCPDMDDINCSCSTTGTPVGTVMCLGYTTQDDVSKFIVAARKSNNVTGADKLDIHRFILYHSNITKLDLSPFLLTRINQLELSELPSLRSIVGPDLATFRGTMEVSTLQISGTDKTDKILGSILEYFSPTHLTKIEIVDSGISGGQYSFTDKAGEAGVEFLPGLSLLTHLTQLDLSGSQVRAVYSGQFRKNTELTRIVLAGNQGLKLGKDAFLMDEPISKSNFANDPLNIVLGGNDLINDDFHCLNNIDSLNRPVNLTINFDRDVINSLNVEFFQPFLRVNPLNSLTFIDGHFECNSQLKWMQDGKDEFEHRVEGCECQNLPGETCFSFTSD